MKCPYCASTKTKVVDKRDNTHEGTTRRRRECNGCTSRFTTYERIENIDLSVEKKNGVVEAFNRDKLRKGILKAVKRNEMSQEDVSDLVDKIEMDLLSKKTNTVSSGDIGNLVLKHFKKVNPVIYMRFASVHKNFKSLDDFNSEIESLKK